MVIFGGSSADPLSTEENNENYLLFSFLIAIALMCLLWRSRCLSKDNKSLKSPEIPANKYKEQCRIDLSKLNNQFNSRQINLTIYSQH